jgi:hypothetical protein
VLYEAVRQNLATLLEEASQEGHGLPRYVERDFTRYHLHANDRQGLERLCRYGARGALALTRLSRAEDGRIAWRMKRPRPDGTWHLYFTGLELIRRTASLIPPPRVNLTRYHGVFAPGAKLKPRLRPGQQGPEASQAKADAPEPRAVEHARKRPPRLDWAGGLRRTFALDVFACCRCGGWRRVLAYVTARQGGACDTGAPGLALPAAETGPSAGAAPERGVLSAQPRRRS